MSDHATVGQALSRRLSRRHLLLEAAWVTAAAAFASAGLTRGILGDDKDGVTARARMSRGTPVAPLSIGYVRHSDTVLGRITDASREALDGTRSRLMPIQALRTRDPRLRDGARVQIHGFFAGDSDDLAAIRSIALDALTPAGIPHHVWRFDNGPVPSIGSPTSFFAPMGDEGLLLQLDIERYGAEPITVHVPFHTDGASDMPKARAGLYVIAFPSADEALPQWSRCAFACGPDVPTAPGQIIDHGRPLQAPHLVISFDTPQPGSGPAL